MRFNIIAAALSCLLLASCSVGAPSPGPTPTTAVTQSADATATLPTTPDDPTPEPEQPTPEEPTIEPTIEPTTEPVLDEPTPEPSPEESGPPLPTLAPTPSGRATPIPIPGGALTIVAMGDSMTEGQGDDPWDKGGYPTRLEEKLNRIRPGSKVINLGKSGWDSTQMVEGQLQQTLDAKPDIALVWIGSNNLWYNNGPEGEPVETINFTNDIDTTLKTLTGAGIRVFIAIIDDQTLRPYTTRVDGLNLSQEGIQHMSRLTNVYNEVIRTRASQYGATTINFYNNPLFADPATVNEDGVHPNARGFDMIAELWFEAIKAELK